MNARVVVVLGDAIQFHNEVIKVNDIKWHLLKVIQM